MDESELIQIASAKRAALETATDAFKQLDTNGDGVVDRNEVMQLV